MSGISSARVFNQDEDDGVGDLPEWEALAVDAVGNTIDFWRFKRNHGRIWALLYLRDKAMSATELQSSLGLSKGAVSMLVRELETWGVIRRVRAPSDDNWRFVAETDFRKMVSRVLEEREASFVRRVKTDLQEAEKLARSTRGVPRDVMARLAKLLVVAQLVDKALRAFLTTARLDLFGVLAVFRDET